MSHKGTEPTCAMRREDYNELYEHLQVFAAFPRGRPLPCLVMEHALSQSDTLLGRRFKNQLMVWHTLFSPARLYRKDVLSACSRSPRCWSCREKPALVVTSHSKIQPVVSDTFINFLLLEGSKPIILSPQKHLVPQSSHPTEAEFWSQGLKSE